MSKNPARNKLRGSTFERKLVNLAKALGLESKRAYASNGEALGEVKEVDLMVAGYRIQAKKRAKLPAYLDIDKGVDMVVFSRDHGEDLTLVPYATVLEWILIAKLAADRVDHETKEAFQFLDDVIKSDGQGE